MEGEPRVSVPYRKIPCKVNEKGRAMNAMSSKMSGWWRRARRFCIHNILRADDPPKRLALWRCRWDLCCLFAFDWSENDFGCWAGVAGRWQQSGRSPIGLDLQSSDICSDVLSWLLVGMQVDARSRQRQVDRNASGALELDSQNRRVSHKHDGCCYSPVPRHLLSCQRVGNS